MVYDFTFMLGKMLAFKRKTVSETMSKTSNKVFSQHESLAAGANKCAPPENSDNMTTIYK